MSEWAATWQLKLAVEKCGIIHVDFSRNDHAIADYTIGGTQLGDLREVKDLGVYVTPDLRFKTHCA